MLKAFYIVLKSQFLEPPALGWLQLQDAVFYRDIDKCCLAGHEDNVTSSRDFRHQLYIWRDVLVVELNVLFQARIEVAVKVEVMHQSFSTPCHHWFIIFNQPVRECSLSYMHKVHCSTKSLPAVNLLEFSCSEKYQSTT